MTGLVKKLLFCGAKSFPTTELPEGHIWVCVGTDEKAQRFELDANYLNHPLFEDLLRLSVPEFGYSYEGALRIACETDLFLHLLNLLRSSNPSVHYMELQDLMERFYASAEASGQHEEPHQHHHHCSC
ncbi:auxin-induced protein 15A [Elaeis guineensis]|uniref:Auxin-induced protein 15A n=1 Tax=Elaeis guineensis var. tenera TaxID=51953 RepID=A0A6I9RT92_ELAGV|nr:auxin-induced protein 15A [Elaeis guineensis]